MEQFLMSAAIIVFGLLAGNRLRKLRDSRRIPATVPLESALGWVTRIVFLVINPLVLVGAFWHVRLEDPKLALLPALGVLSLVLGGLLAIGLSRLHKHDRPQTGAMFVSGSFTNIGNFGTLFCFMFLGEQSLVFVAMFRLFEEFVYYAIGFPIAKLYGRAPEDGRGKRTLARLVSDPFIVASFTAILLGIALQLSPWERPDAYKLAMDALVPLSTGLLVVTVGYGMRLSAVRTYLRESLSISAVKFVLVPLCILPLAWLLGIGQLHGGMALQVVLILSFMPPAFTSLVPPRLYGLDADLANASWLVNTVMIVLLLPVIYLAVQAL